MHSINRLVFGNNQGDTMNVGQKVRWHVLCVGTGVYPHSLHLHGVALLYNGKRIDEGNVLPAAVKVYDLVPDSPGTWMFHCHVNDHIDEGMNTTFIVNKRFIDSQHPKSLGGDKPHPAVRGLVCALTHTRPQK